MNKSAVEEFLETAGRFWLKADHVKPGDRLEILEEPTVDEREFLRGGKTQKVRSLVFRGRLLRTGEEFNVRLGAQNVTRIVEVLGKGSWRGQMLEVERIEKYPGLGKSGIVWRGVKAEAKPEAVSKEALEFLKSVKAMVEQGYPLLESMVPGGVKAELARLGLIVEKEGLLFFTEKARGLVK